MALDRSLPIVCFAGDDYWTANPHSRFHYMQALHRRGHPILWINSIGMNLPRIGGGGFLKRVAGKLDSWRRFFREVAPGFHVLSPVALPLYGHRRAAAASDAWLERQVRWAYRKLGISEPIVYASVPTFAEVILRLPRAGLLYYYSDKYDAYRDLTARAEIQRRDRALFAAADAVFCVSREIHASLLSRRDHVYYLPHAVDAAHFRRALADSSPEPLDLAAIPRPRIGYFGSLGRSIDANAILHAARALPDHQFVLVGKVLADFGELAKLPNVHFLGAKPYREIPRYGRGFDVAFMLFLPSEWIYHCSPLKTKEYLSLGLPVISCPIREIELELADVVSVVHDENEFVDAIERELKEDSPQKRSQRRIRVENDSWDARTQQMWDHFVTARRERQQPSNTP